MELDFKDLKNKHKDSPCIIVGTSPSMMDFDYKNFKGIIIAVGTSVYRFPSNFNKIDYIISCNNEFPIIEIKSHLKILNKNKKTTWLMSDTGCYNELWDYDKTLFDKLKIDYFCFDDRHFKKKPCKEIRKCCEFLKIYPERITLVEQIGNLMGVPFRLKKAGTTVAELGLAFALLFGCKNIIFQGIDLPLTTIKDKSNPKYKVYRNKIGDIFEMETNSFLRKKYFFYYLKNLNFRPYFFGLIKRIKYIITKKTIFGENFKN